MRLLHLDSSILSDHSASRMLTRAIVNRWQAANPEIHVTYRDLAAEALPHLTGASLSKADAQESALSAQALEDFLAADVIVIGAPMYNFTIPSQLKAWIDRILVAGKTFRYTSSGVEGLAGGKRVLVAVSRGGVYPVGGPGEFVESYLRHVFGFVGIRDVTFVRAEGLALSPQHREKNLGAALDSITEPLSVAA